MLTKTQAVVLRSLKYGDKKLIVDMFTREYGMLTFSCSVSSRGKGKNKSNYFQSLNIVEVEFDMRPKADIHIIRDIRLDYPPRTIPYNPYKLSIAMFLAEFLRYALVNEQQHIALYTYIEHSIEWLDNADREFANFHLVFMMKLSHFIGFHPNIEAFNPGSWFDMQSGEFSAAIPSHNAIVTPSDASIIPVIDRLS